MFLFEIFKAILFGVVEGVTEWLPVSSTGHMILLGSFLSLDVSDEFYDLFEVVVQLGAVLAVLVFFSGRLFCFGSLASTRRSLRIWLLTAIAVLPSAIVGFLFDDLLDGYFYNPPTVAAMLVLYGVLFILFECFFRGGRRELSDVSELSIGRALTIGLFQVLALIPGTSRSGATMLGACLLGASRTLAAEFSFFLALPTMAGAGILRGAKLALSGYSLSPREAWLLFLGTLTAFLVSLVTVRALMAFVRRHGFFGFGVYRIALGALVLIYHFTGRL